MKTITHTLGEFHRTAAFVLVGVLALALLGCSSGASSGASDKLVITLNWLGVRTDNQIKFYDIDKGLQHNPEYDFALPAGADELVITLNWLGVRTDNQIKFYDIDKGFQHNPKYDFVLP